MALTTPILLTLAAFDASKSQNFIFESIGGDQVTANTLTIKENSDNSVVYSQRQETFKFEHLLPANILQNGVYYTATITTHNALNQSSLPSTPIQFWCYTLPTISFTNIPSDRIIDNASYTFNFTYDQEENENLALYVVNLYNSQQSLISTSGNLYPATSTLPFNGSYTFSGFENSTVYYVEVKASTVEGTQISSGLQQITVRYSHPDLFALIELVNNCEEGYITIYSNMTSIDGKSNPSPPIYIDNSEVDLTNPDSWVMWDEGFSINGDFLARLWYRNPTPATNANIITFSNINGQTITLYHRQGYPTVEDGEQKAYVCAVVTELNGFHQYYYSNYKDILLPTSYYCLWLTRKGNTYQLQLGYVTQSQPSI